MAYHLNIRPVIQPVMALNKSPADELDIGSLSITSPASDATPSRPSPPELSKADKAVREYLLQNSTSFAAVDEIRERVSPSSFAFVLIEIHTGPPYQGWSSPEGDKFYQQKRKRVMNTSTQDEWKFFNMYAQIADTMQTQTNAFTISSPDSSPLRALNLCLAPGGYTKKLLDMYPTIQISGITLAPSAGGHEVLVSDPRLSVEYLDMNLLPLSYGLTPSTLPPTHPNAPRFLLSAPFPSLTYNLVLDDGAVLRSHTRDAHRHDKDHEALRLRLAQLIFGLERLKAGGTFVILLHRIDSFENMVLLRNFEQFAKVEVWKPERYYAQSSSFYLIAKEVQVGHAWRCRWWRSGRGCGRGRRFGGLGGEGEEVSGERVARALEGYGERFVQLGGPVWGIQAGGLARAAYIRPRSEQGNGRYDREERGSRLTSCGAMEGKFPRYTGGLTWLSEPTKGEDKEMGGALEEKRALAASKASWRA